jgi:hypothetical protein
MHFFTQELLGTSRDALVMFVFAYFLERRALRQLRLQARRSCRQPLLRERGNRLSYDRHHKSFQLWNFALGLGV